MHIHLQGIARFVRGHLGPLDGSGVGQDPVLLTPAQVSDLLQVPVRTVYKRAEEGEWEHVKLGRSLRFRREYIMDLIGRSTRGGDARGRND